VADPSSAALLGITVTGLFLAVLKRRNGRARKTARREEGLELGLEVEAVRVTRSISE